MRKGWVFGFVVAAIGLGVFGQVQQAASVEAASVAEESAVQVAVADEESAAAIPANAIRLRIIANSDAPEDQQLKRDIRDKVIAAVAEELRGVESDAAAREKIRAALPKFKAIAEQVIAEQGFAYAAATDFGLVPFPTKMYGSQVYPAGEYEALRIQIGAAQGQNWWCVLFPPLCFVDMANGDAVAQPKDMEAQQQAKPVATVEVENKPAGEPKEVEVRFALVDKIRSIFKKIFA
jgi:stage II sporulation protein R